jgi:nitroreductase
METRDAIFKRRTVRRFSQEKVPDELLSELVDAARVAPSGGNSQPLRYFVVRETETVRRILDQTAWAGHVKPARNPQWGVNSPMAFIVLTASSKLAGVGIGADAGAAVQNILLRAVDLGLGACWIGAFKPEKVNEIIGIGTDGTALFLVAIGYPGESPVLEEIGTEDSRKYYLDGNDCIHVPKLSLESVTTWI